MTVDHVLRVDAVPGSDEKIVADTSGLAFGGPAANAAATASVLGSDVVLVAAFGVGPLAAIARGGLEGVGVEVVDLATGRAGPPVATVLLTNGTGERAVVLSPAPEEADVEIPVGVLDGCDALLVDGHRMQVAVELARRARARGVPVVLDGGSWKRGTDRLLQHVDVAVVSSDFTVPDGRDALEHLAAAGCRAAARSAGGRPVAALLDGRRFDVAVPVVEDVVDTLGAGDVLHGALTHELALSARGVAGFEQALRRAVVVASRSVAGAGAHGWFASPPVPSTG